MGYCMDLTEHSFKIKKEYEQNIIESLQNFAKSKIGRIMWVDKEPLLESNTLLEVFDEIRYSLKTDINGDYELDEFIGEKMGDDLETFNSIAMYIEPNSFIEFEGEDGDVFRFLFDGEECKYKFIENVGIDNYYR